MTVTETAIADSTSGLNPEATGFAPTTESTLTRRGSWCFAAGLIGVLQGAVMLAWPHQVDNSMYSFPLTATGYFVAQATFFLQHLPLVVAVGTIAAMPAVRREKLSHRSLVVATAGLVLLALMELIAMIAATATENSTLGTVINSLYSIPVLLTGAGLGVAGINVLRHRTLGRPLSWILIATGGFVFVVLTPVMATNSFVGGRLAIMAWMAMFALLGFAMRRPER